MLGWGSDYFHFGVFVCPILVTENVLSRLMKERSQRSKTCVHVHINNYEEIVRCPNLVCIPGKYFEILKLVYSS